MHAIIGNEVNSSKHQGTWEAFEHRFNFMSQLSYIWRVCVNNIAMNPPG